MTDAHRQRIAETFVLGTAQIGMAYGRTRISGIMDEGLADAILSRAQEIGVRVFDTAEAYGSSTERLAKWLQRSVGRMSVVTKVKPGPDLARRVREACERFADRDVTVLSHGFVDGAEWETIRAAGESGHVGQSVYEPDEVGRAAASPGIARIQAPGSVVDDGAIQARGGSACPVDIRSVFLQGVLLESPQAAESRARGAGRLVAAVMHAARDGDGARGALLIAAVLLGLRAGDRVVLGVDDPEQLSVIPEALLLSGDRVQAFVHSVRSQVGSVERAVLDPRRWS